MGQRPLNATLDRLMVHANPLSYGKERRVFAISQKHLRTLHPARRLGSRPRKGRQARNVFICHHHLKGLPPSSHDVAPRSALLKRGIHKHNSSSMQAGFIEAGFMESVV
jgi:hypothetical protein